jgi:hypothetical protein
MTTKGRWRHIQLKKKAKTTKKKAITHLKMIFINNKV